MQNARHLIGIERGRESLEKIRKFITKQYYFGNYIGGAKDLAQRVLAYITIVNLVLLVITTYSVSKFVNQVSIFWFIGALVFLILFAMLMEYKFILSSSWGFTNQQMYKHFNPLWERLDKQEKKQKKELEAMEERLNKRFDAMERKMDEIGGKG